MSKLKVDHVLEKRASKDKFKISEPMNFQQKVHVDQDYNWVNNNPTQIFELGDKLGEGAFGVFLMLK